MDDVKLALEELVEEAQRPSNAAVAPLTATTGRVSRRLGVAATGALILVVAAVGAGLLARGGHQARRSPAPVSGALLTPITADSGLSCDPALSPNGKLLAYASDRSGEGNLGYLGAAGRRRRIGPHHTARG